MSRWSSFFTSVVTCHEDCVVEASVSRSRLRLQRILNNMKKNNNSGVNRCEPPKHVDSESVTVGFGSWGGWFFTPKIPAFKEIHDRLSAAAKAGQRRVFQGMVFHLVSPQDPVKHNLGKHDYLHLLTVCSIFVILMCK